MFFYRQDVLPFKFKFNTRFLGFLLYAIYRSTVQETPISMNKKYTLEPFFECVSNVVKIRWKTVEGGRTGVAVTIQQAASRL